MGPPNTSDPPDEALVARLTPRQRELLELVSRGLTNDDIASALQISPTTVRTHMTAIYAKLEVTNRTEATTVFHRGSAPAQSVEAVLRRPAIAVLSFEVIGGTARADMYGVGIGYDLASIFARLCWFPVVSTVSTAQARSFGDYRAIGRRLGATFIVDGTIRVADPFRITVRIDDSENNTCIWTGRYECSARAFFATQDAICDEIVSTVYPLMITRVLSAQRASPAHALLPWELAHCGMGLQALRAASSNRKAILRFEEALSREPDLVLAHFGLGLASYSAMLNQWDTSVARSDELLRCAQSAIRLSPHSAEGFYLLARHHQARSELDKAGRALSSAVTLNPSFAMAHALMAQILQLNGESDMALVSMRRACRLNTESFVAGLSSLHFMREEYDLSLTTAEQCIRSRAGYAFAYVLAAASAHCLGDDSRGMGHFATLRAIQPGFDLSRLLASFGANVAAVERLVSAVRALETAAGRRA